MVTTDDPGTLEGISRGCRTLFIEGVWGGSIETRMGVTVLLKFIQILENSVVR